MKCLSVRQPWATLVVLGAKRFETRTWSTQHRGPLAIQAANQLRQASKDLCYEEPFRTILIRAGFDSSTKLPLGAIIGTVELVDCKPASDLTGIEANELHFGDFRPGRWAWHLANAVQFPEPIQYPGHLGVFEVPDHLLAASPLRQWGD